MHLVGARGQIVRDFIYDASGTVTTGGAAQLVLPEHNWRTSLFIQNISTGNLFVEFGGARATVALSGNTLGAFTITNAGFGYTVPPQVRFYGGGDLTKNPNALIPGLPGNQGPSNPGSAHAVLAGGVVSSIVLDSPGKNYIQAPYVFLRSSENDPYGAATPSATNGALLAANGGSLYFNGTALTTDALAIYGATTGQAYTVKYTIGG